MKPQEYLLMLVKAYNPNQYERLLEKPGKEFIVFLLFTLCIAVIIFCCAIIPMTVDYTENLGERLTPVTQFTLSANVTSDAPIVLLNRPQVVIDTAANSTSSRTITLSDQGILYPTFFYFGNSMIPWNDLNDIKAQSPRGGHLVTMMILFLLPSIIFWFLLLTLSALVLLFFIIVLLGYTLPRLFGHRILFKNVMKIGLLSFPSILVMDIGLYPLAPLFWWGFALTLIYFFFGIMLVSEPHIKDDLPHKNFEHRPHHKV